MFRAGEKIIYGSSGVCTVLEVAVPPFAGKDERDRLYYKLRPAGGSEVIYTPVDTTVFMRAVMSRQEAEELIARLPEIPEEVCSAHSVTLLRQQYDACFRDHSCESYARLAKGIYKKGHEGRKLGQTDQRYMKRAEDLLCGELAAALDMDPAEVPAYIMSKLNEG